MTEAKRPPAPAHRPVLLNEVIEWLQPRPGALLVDGTVGAGGHAAELARRVEPGGRVIGLDRDPAMLALAQTATQNLPVTLIHSPYDELEDVLESLAIEAVDGLLLDLGLSSDQLAWSYRGFSFTHDGPLDMRFDTQDDSIPNAADLVNSLPADELADILYQLGEERHSRRIARRIEEVRQKEPITTTAQLAAIVRRSIPGKWGQIDPATRTFQALRIAVNHELDRLDTTLQKLPQLLKPNARAAIISFHSLEDRRVKWAFRNNPELHVLTRKPVVASPQECQQNPRARSAKLRVAERCTNPNPLPNPSTPEPKPWTRTR